MSRDVLVSTRGSEYARRQETPLSPSSPAVPGDST